MTPSDDDSLWLPSNYVVDGVGLPSVFLGRSRTGEETWLTELPEERTGLVLSRESRHLLLRQLAIWCGDRGVSQAYWLRRDKGAWRLYQNFGAYQQTHREVCSFIWGAWSATCHEMPGATPKTPSKALRAILINIGKDHSLRRKLGWEVSPGSVGNWRKQAHSAATWTLSHGEDSHDFDVGGDLIEARDYLCILEQP